MWESDLSRCRIAPLLFLTLAGCGTTPPTPEQAVATASASEAEDQQAQQLVHRGERSANSSGEFPVPRHAR